MKVPRPFLSVERSVFLKMLCVLSLAGVLIDGAVFLASQTVFRPRTTGGPHKTFEGYAQLVAAEIARDDGFEKARELASRFELGFRIEGDGWGWASDPTLPTIASLPPRGSRHRSVLSLPRHLGGHSGFRPHSVVEQRFPRGPARVAVFFPKAVFNDDVNWRGVLLLVSVLTLVLWSSYRLIRWILAPLRAMTEAVTRVAEGDFDCHVPYEGRDELGQLSSAFNRMSRRLKEMMEMKKHLLIDVSHELRSPLARAAVALDAIPDARIKKEIAEEVDEMDRLVNRILEGARLESGRHPIARERVDLSTLVRAVVQRHKEWGDRVAVSDVLAPLAVDADAELLRTVLKNLVENAVKYSPPTTTVRISLETRGSEAALTVSDEGCGIPPEELSRVMEPFYRVDKSRTRSTGGFGLGLSLCQRIVAAHGGRIEIASEPGKGTRVTVFLPFTEPDPTA